MITKTFKTKKTSFNTSISININPWQDKNLSPTSLQSETKTVYKSHADNNYQRNSRILLSNTNSKTNKHNTQTTNRQHLHYNKTSIWNRLVNRGVWSKSNFMPRICTPPLESNRKLSSNQDVWSKKSYDDHHQHQATKITNNINHQTEFISILTSPSFKENIDIYINRIKYKQTNSLEPSTFPTIQKIIRL